MAQAITCQGWLYIRSADAWMPTWAILVRGEKPKTMALIYCESWESMQVQVSERMGWQYQRHKHKSVCRLYVALVPDAHDPPEVHFATAPHDAL